MECDVEAVNYWTSSGESWVRGDSINYCQISGPLNLTQVQGVTFLNATINSLDASKVFAPALWKTKRIQFHSSWHLDQLKFLKYVCNININFLNRYVFIQSKTVILDEFSHVCKYLKFFLARIHYEARAIIEMIKFATREFFSSTSFLFFKRSDDKLQR